MVLRALAAWWLGLLVIAALLFGSLHPTVLLLVLMGGSVGLPAGLFYLGGGPHALTGAGPHTVVAVAGTYWGAMLVLHGGCVAFRRWSLVAVIVLLSAASFAGCMVEFWPLAEMRHAFQ